MAFVIIDDCGLQPLTAADYHDLVELTNAHYGWHVVHGTEIPADAFTSLAVLSETHRYQAKIILVEQTDEVLLIIHVVISNFKIFLWNLL